MYQLKFLKFENNKLRIEGCTLKEKTDGFFFLFDLVFIEFGSFQWSWTVSLLYDSISQIIILNNYLSYGFGVFKKVKLLLSSVYYGWCSALLVFVNCTYL